MPRRTTILFAAAVSGVALALALITVMVVGARNAAAPTQGTAGASMQAGGVGQPQVGGPFTLVDQDGRTVTEALLKDRWTLVFFGFTYCPDYCPTTLAMLEATQRELGRDGEDLQIVFVSVDPERDTPAALKDYLSSPGFPEGVIGLTGTPDQVAAVAKAYGAYFEKAGEGENYTMNHSLAIWLMGPDGASRLSLNHQLGPERTAQLIRSARARG
ncbi:MAG: SCO family protein [Alphaproteobacteria bacterium]|nr:SCO family protein [Alphaproteobacteria bacterium]MBU1526407.1 SCO family protein [Alphaproteobacteria bacterium]MBU2117102.1 SCO family protein [Alphaproteobacteria bacterium]MBU2352272.1 SCO family protein [Alphaproteobacteria bacterium]MBU2381577.1 SCO family protein [Alphaproteobacteria bacterium]